MKYNVDVSLTANLINLLDCGNRSNIFDYVSLLRKERDEAAANALAFSTELNELMADELLDRLGLETGYTPEQFHASMKGLFNERDAAQRLEGLVITDMDGITLDWELSEGVVEIAHSTQPQLTEIRYVLHGDIQPCSVLYTDDTTTLLRLDEGDMMLETDTIEWSDSVTYRCQELLKSAAVKLSVPVTLSPIKLFAQLVRDERILLNDNGDDVVKPEPLRDDELFLNAETLWCCTECHYKFHVSLALCPQCHTPKTAHIKVDNFSSESLAPGSIEQPCDECSHIFDAQSMTCPMCNTIRSSEWTDTNSPTPLR